MYLSWIIPAYNEEKRIAKTLREVAEYLREKHFDYEVIVVDNSSRDRTSEVVRSIQAEIREIRILQTHGPGKGWAVREGMRHAKGDIRIFADADNSVFPNQFDNFLPYICSERSEKKPCFDVVIGSIEASGAVIEEHAQWYRRALGKLSKYIIRLISGLWDVKDTQRGFKLFSKQAAEIIFSRQTVTGWGFDIEILLIARRHGFKIKEVPVIWVNPPESKVNLKAYVTTLVELLKIKFNDIMGRYRF